MHQEIHDGELKRQRAKAAAEANNKLAHRFEVGDLVMVTVAKTSVNASCKTKPRLRWQGPLEVTSVPEGAPSVLFVRLLGDPPSVKPVAVHWTRLKRFAGKEFARTPQLIKSAQHDFGKFKIDEFVGWRVGPAGAVQLLVSWHGFEAHDNSWEDIDQLIEDAPYRVRNFLAENAEGHPPLQQVYDDECE